MGFHRPLGALIAIQNDIESAQDLVRGDDSLGQDRAVILEELHNMWNKSRMLIMAVRDF